MEAILLRFKVFITRDFDGVEREYSDVMLNPKKIMCVYEETDINEQPYTVIEFDSQQTTRDRESPIIQYMTEEKMFNILERVNTRQVLENGVIPTISKKYLTDDD